MKKILCTARKRHEWHLEGARCKVGWVFVVVVCING